MWFLSIKKSIKAYFQSPYWYVRRGKHAQAKNALKKILGPSRGHKLEKLYHVMKISNSNETKPSITCQVVFIASNLSN